MLKVKFIAFNYTLNSSFLALPQELTPHWACCRAPMLFLYLLWNILVWRQEPGQCFPAPSQFNKSPLPLQCRQLLSLGCRRWGPLSEAWASLCAPSPWRNNNSDLWCPSHWQSSIRDANTSVQTHTRWLFIWPGRIPRPLQLRGVSA